MTRAADPAGPRVSVCVPTYDGSEFLAGCLDSIVAQSHGDFELLVVDDCSNDDSVAVARRVLDGDARARIVENDANLGLVGNWNRCIALARGEWIKFVFQDDALEPSCIERLLACADADPRVEFVACARRVEFVGDIAPTVRRAFARHEAILDALYGRASWLAPRDYVRARATYFDETWNLVGEPTSTLIRRSLFARFGDFDARVKQVCDAEMWDRLASRVGVGFCLERLATFRVHAGAQSERNRVGQALGTLLEDLVALHATVYAPRHEAFREHLERADFVRLERLVHETVHAIRDCIRWIEDASARDAARASFERLLPGLAPLRPSAVGYLRHRVAGRLRAWRRR